MKEINDEDFLSNFKKNKIGYVMIAQPSCPICEEIIKKAGKAYYYYEFSGKNTEITNLLITAGVSKTPSLLLFIGTNNPSTLVREIEDVDDFFHKTGELNNE